MRKTRLFRNVPTAIPLSREQVAVIATDFLNVRNFPDITYYAEYIKLVCTAENYIYILAISLEIMYNIMGKILNAFQAFKSIFCPFPEKLYYMLKSSVIFPVLPECMPEVISNRQEAFLMNDKTMTFSVNDDKEKELKKNLTIIYDALMQKGYNPISQIVGYILSEDPTYITTYNNARNLIRHIDRDELLQVLVSSYLNS